LEASRSAERAQTAVCDTLSKHLHTGAMRRLEMSDAFALVLKKHRTRKRLSQELLAEKAELHPTYIGLVERHLRNPSLNVAKALADGLEMPLAKLVGEAEALKRKPGSR
jgi:ribosome-binding protein aMBF1 (putative translation factor)